MRKIVILIAVIIFFISFIGLGGYVILLNKEKVKLLEENFYYLNKSNRAENDIKGLSYLLITTEIDLKTTDSVLSNHPEIESFVEIPPQNSIKKMGMQLMTLTLGFSSDSILDVITYYPLLPVPSNNYSTIEDSLIIKKH